MRTIAAVAAGLVVTILVATSVTLAVLQYQARTNNQQVNLRNGVTLSQDSAIVQAAAKARPAVVSIVTQRQPAIVDGSGYLARIDGGTSGGPLLNVGSQVVGIAMESPAATAGFGLNVADIQDDVQQILSSTGQVTVASIGATTSDVSPESAALNGVPEGTQLVVLYQGGPAATAGLR